MKILKIDSTGKRFAGSVAESEIEAGVLSGVLNINFDYADLVYSSPVPIGVVPAGKTIHRVVVDVQNVFDGSAVITVGDSVGNASLMIHDEVDLSVADKFTSEPDLKYNVDTAFRIYVVSGSPTMGLANIKIYYQ